MFAIVLGAVAVPGTALAVPTFLMFSQLGLTNTLWAVIIPSLITPFGLYLMWVYALDAVPDELLEAARIDGAGELRTFFTIARAAARPGHRHRPAVHHGRHLEQLLPSADHAQRPRTVPAHPRPAALERPGHRRRREPIYNLVITGSLLTILPIVVPFLLLQRYWQSGLAAGSVKE